MCKLHLYCDTLILCEDCELVLVVNLKEVHCCVGSVRLVDKLRK